MHKINDDKKKRAKDFNIKALVEQHFGMTAEGDLNSSSPKYKCPFHSEKTASFTLNLSKNEYHCFGCSAHGDTINFVMEMNQITFVEAVSYLVGENVIKESPPPEYKQREKQQKQMQYKPIIPIPENLEEEAKKCWVDEAERKGIRYWNLNKNQYSLIQNPNIYFYRSTDERLIGYRMVFFIKEQKIPMFIFYAELENKHREWIAGSLDSFYLYGLQNKDKMPRSTCYLVEGEKTADKLNEFINEGIDEKQKRLVLGYTNNSKTDFSEITGYSNVIIIPDADVAGVKMLFDVENKEGKKIRDGIISKITACDGNTSIKIVDPQQFITTNKGWDFADAIGWSRKLILSYIEDNRTSVENFKEKYKQIIKYDDFNVNLYTGKEFAGHYLSLGKRGDLYYFYTKNQEILTFKGSQLGSVSTFLQLAPLDHWITHKDKTHNKKDNDPEALSKKDIMQIADKLIRASENKNFSIKIIAKNGIYYQKQNDYFKRPASDRGGAVFIHSGEKIDIFTQNSKKILQHKCVRLDETRNTGFRFVKSNKDDCHSFNFVKMSEDKNQEFINFYIKTISHLPLAEKSYVVILAGWLFASMFLSNLRWKPHLWVYGRRGSGKSWIVSNIIKPILKGFSVSSLGSTEAGMRQLLNGKSLVAIYDEADDRKKYDEKDEMIRMLRIIASATGEDSIIKGGSDGSPKEYVVKSPFFLSSIDLATLEDADLDRIFVLKIDGYNSIHGGQKETKKNWEDNLQKMGAFFSEKANIEKLVSAFVSRSFDFFDFFETVAKEIASIMEIRQRDADNFAVVVSGWLALKNLEPTKVNITAVAKEYHLLDYLKNITDVEAPQGEMEILRRIFHKTIKVYDEKTIHEKTLLEIIEQGQGAPPHEREALARFGVRHTKQQNKDGFIMDGIIISNTNTELKKLIKLDNWHRILDRILGSKQIITTFSSNTERCMYIPKTFYEATEEIKKSTNFVLEESHSTTADNYKEIEGILTPRNGNPSPHEDHYPDHDGKNFN